MCGNYTPIFPSASVARQATQSEEWRKALGRKRKDLQNVAVRRVLVWLWPSVCCLTGLRGERWGEEVFGRSSPMGPKDCQYAHGDHDLQPRRPICIDIESVRICGYGWTLSGKGNIMILYRHTRCPNSTPQQGAVSWVFLGQSLSAEHVEKYLRRVRSDPQMASLKWVPWSWVGGFEMFSDVLSIVLNAFCHIMNILCPFCFLKDWPNQLYNSWIVEMGSKLPTSRRELSRTHKHGYFIDVWSRFPWFTARFRGHPKTRLQPEGFESWGNFRAIFYGFPKMLRTVNCQVSVLSVGLAQIQVVTNCCELDAIEDTKVIIEAWLSMSWISSMGPFLPNKLGWRWANPLISQRCLWPDHARPMFLSLD